MINSRMYRSIAQAVSDATGDAIVSAMVTTDDGDRVTVTLLTAGLHYDGTHYTVRRAYIASDAFPVYGPEPMDVDMGGGRYFEHDYPAALAHWVEEVRYETL